MSIYAVIHGAAAGSLCSSHAKVVARHVVCGQSRDVLEIGDAVVVDVHPGHAFDDEHNVAIIMDKYDSAEVEAAVMAVLIGDM